MRNLFLLLFILGIMQSCKQIESPQPHQVKVLIDTDMIEAFDDGVALMMLHNAPGVEVLGVTTVTGNTWSQEGLAYGIRQLEICGGTEIPILAGANLPLSPGRLDRMKEEVARNAGTNSWLGAAMYEPIKDWKAFYENRYGEQPTLTATQEEAADFIIRQVKAHPGEVTLLAIGPCTNIAQALEKAPEIAGMTKEIIYMGGAFLCDGNTTPYAEFNILIDPEAAAQVFRAPFPRQVVVSLDVCNKVPMDSTRFFSLYSQIKNEKLKDVFQRCFHYEAFTQNPTEVSSIWDVISAALLVDPSILKSSLEARIDVDDDSSSATYGKTFITPDSTRQQALIPTEVDTAKIWRLIEDYVVSQ